MPISDTGEFFAKTLIPTIGGGGRRVPFTFTSTKRLLENGKDGVGASRDLLKLDAEQARKRELDLIEHPTRTGLSVETIGALGASPLLSANQSTTRGQDSTAMPVISMMVNPHTIKWNQPKRYSKRDTQEGSVFYHFTNKYGQNNDILVMHFSGNTGHIGTRSGPINTMQTGADLKLRMWHELYALTREPLLLPEVSGQNFSLSNVKNEIFISYRTVLMPTPIVLIGFFNSVLEFSESAQNPYSRDYSFGFTVTNTSPSLDTLVDKINGILAPIGPISATGQVL